MHKTTSMEIGEFVKTLESFRRRAAESLKTLGPFRLALDWNRTIGNLIHLVFKRFRLYFSWSDDDCCKQIL